MHAEAAERVGSRVTAVCDVDAGRGSRLADRFEAAVHTKVGDLLDRRDVDGVVVAVPNALHRELAVETLEAGKDLLLEKPMALNVRECDAVIAARGDDQIAQVGFVCRYAPSVAIARRYVTEGHLGRIYHAKANLYRRRGIPGLGRWFTTRALSGGGVLIDLGVHLIDLAMHLTDRRDPVRVSGSCTSTFGAPISSYTYNEMWAGPPNPDGVFDVDDGAHALVRFGDGMTLEVNTTWAANIPEETLQNGIVLFGDRGGLVLDLWNNKLMVATEQLGQLVDIAPQMPPGDAWDQAWSAEHIAFANACDSRTPPEASLAHGRCVQAVLDAIYQSSEKQREVEVAGE